MTRDDEKGGVRRQGERERRGQGERGVGGNVREETLLIDLRSPVGLKEGYEEDHREESVAQEEQKLDYKIDEEEEMMLSFTQLAQRGSPLAMLRRLPPDASSLGVAAFAPSPSLYSSPGGSPVRAGCLTPSKLCTPIGSPLARPATLASNRI